VKGKNSWTKSKISNLYRHDSSGIYYAPTKVNGVVKWATIETYVFSVAQARLSKELAELKQGQGATKAFRKGIATFGDADISRSANFLSDASGIRGSVGSPAIVVTCWPVIPESQPLSAGGLAFLVAVDFLRLTPSAQAARQGTSVGRGRTNPSERRLSADLVSRGCRSITSRSAPRTRLKFSGMRFPQDLSASA
jgi:hypothetical protein